MDNNKDFAYKLGYLVAGILAILSTLVLIMLGVAAVKLLIWVIGLQILREKHVHTDLDTIHSTNSNSCSYLRTRNSQAGRRVDEGGEEMEKEVKPYYEDDYQSLDEVDTVDLLEMKEGALNDLNENERTIHRINQILASRAIYATQLELF